MPVTAEDFTLTEAAPSGWGSDSVRSTQLPPDNMWAAELEGDGPSEADHGSSPPASGFENSGGGRRGGLVPRRDERIFSGTMPELKRVLIVGEDPQLVDFSDPAIPPGTDAKKIRKGLEDSLAQLRRQGREADLLLTTSADSARGEVEKALAGKPYDCVVVGAGLRIVPKMTPLFEVVMNAVHESAPRAKLAFNLAPDDSAAAAERQL